MIDMLHTLASRGFSGRITAVSRQGYLPKPHRKTPASGNHPVDLLEFPRTANGFAEKLRRDMELLNFEGRDWHIAIDRIRSRANDVWNRLPLGEQADRTN